MRDQLLQADTKNVLSIVDEMAPYRGWINPLLRDAYREAEAGQKPDSRKQLHASIALLPVDANQKEYLYSRLLDATPQELPVLRDALIPHQKDLLARLWTIVELKRPAKGKEGQRLRAACALAKYDPNSKQWANVTEPVVNDFVSVPTVYLEHWMDFLRPVAGQLQASLEAVYRDTTRTEAEHNLATNILADYAADQPRVLADLLMDADDRQFTALFATLKEHGEPELTYLHAEIDRRLDGVVDEEAKEKLAKRQANAAVALLRMDRSTNVWPLLKHSPDPTVRSYLLHRLGPMGADARDIIERLEVEPEVSIRRALILCLGAYKDAQMTLSDRPRLVERLFTMYETEPDAGLRAAAEWLLRTWGQGKRIEAVDAKLRLSEEQIRKRLLANSGGGCRWYVNSQGQTMVVIPGPVEFTMGSPPSEAGHHPRELQHRDSISRTFAIASKAVTVGEYRRFHGDHPLTETTGPLLDYPAIWTSWLEAAAYCNRLSQEARIDRDQWCYETNPQGEVTRLKDKYLTLTGYRLPTEAETEYATRASAFTSRYYGEAKELLGKYAWFVENCGGLVGPGGKLKPNDFGLFDTHGNVWCWCQETFQDYRQGQSGQVFEDAEDDLVIDPQQKRALRGICYTDQALGIRSASRWQRTPERGTNLVGFRVARTIAAK